MEKIISNRIFIPVLLAALLFMVSCKGPHEAAGNYLYYVDYEGLQVIKNPDSTLTLDFEDYLGNPVHMDNIALPDVETELFNENGVVVLVTTAGEVYYTRPVTDGTRTLAVNPQGMAVRHERILGVDMNIRCCLWTRPQGTYTVQH